MHGSGRLVTNLCPIFATPWTVAHQTLLSMEFPSQEYWSGYWRRNISFFSIYAYVHTNTIGPQYLWGFVSRTLQRYPNPCILEFLHKKS